MEHIAELLSLDVYRDGGSLSASFRDNDGARHALVIWIDNDASGKSDGFKIYKSASIESFIESEYLSSVTGVSSPRSEKREKRISWSEAANLLGKLEPFLEGFVSDYLWVYHRMVIVVGNEKHGTSCD